MRHEGGGSGAAQAPARIARIVETEAYRGPKDLACHARAGLTRRTRTLLGKEGHAYVFLIYGMYDCFNVTCRGERTGHAVLVRAGEPVAGFAPGTLAALRAQGYAVNVRDGHWSNGECIAIDPKTGELEGGQDHRSHYGKAAGY